MYWRSYRPDYTGIDVAKAISYKHRKSDVRYDGWFRYMLENDYVYNRKRDKEVETQHYCLRKKDKHRWIPQLLFDLFSYCELGLIVGGFDKRFTIIKNEGKEQSVPFREHRHFIRERKPCKKH